MTPVPPPVPDGIGPRRPVSWREALDRLEAHAERAEQMIGGDGDPGQEPWLPPTGLGPIPDEFVPRARQLLARQQKLMEAIPAMLSDKHQQRQVADRVADATTAPHHPVYLDITA